MPDEYMVADEALTYQARLYKTELLAALFGARAFAASAAPELSALEVLGPGNNVVGVGFGAKATVGAGVYDGLAVRVYVRSKLPKVALLESEMVPPEVNGMPTDVIAVGDIVALARPTPCGVSVGHYATTAGTLGCLVVPQDAAQDSDPLILSNNHVLADVNAAALGDAILEPGRLDGGDPADPIAALTDFEPIDFTGTNVMDAAVAKLFRPGDVTPDILGGIGRVAVPTMAAALYQSVRKHGRTTLHTVGVVMDLAADIRVRLVTRSGTREAAFEDQLAVIGSGGAFSSGGDSGSLVVDAVTRRPVGLLFAGGGGTTFVNPIEPVLGRFGVAIL